MLKFDRMHTMLLSMFVTTASSGSKDYEDCLVSQFESCVDAYNLPRYATLNEDVDAALSNSLHVITWERVDPNGPRIPTLSPQRPLVGTSFKRLAKWLGPAEESVSPAAVSLFSGGKRAAGAGGVAVDRTRILACNGWIWGGT